MITPVPPPGPDTQAPTVPGNLTATAVSGSQIDLGWTAATDNVAVTEYRVERCLTASCSFRANRDGTGDGHDLQRHRRAVGGHQLRLPGTGDGRGAEPGTVFECGERDDTGARHAGTDGAGQSDGDRGEWQPD